VKATNRRRADGKLRGAYARYKKRKRAERRQAERAEWLANFDAKDRRRFFRYSLAETEGIFLRGFSRDLNLPQEEAAPLLERLGDERGWMKLRTKTGMVVGIAPPDPNAGQPRIHVPPLRRWGRR
jgi:hypothetical protein